MKDPKKLTYKIWKDKSMVFEDSHKGYDFLIKYIGEPIGIRKHYCGYVKIPKNHKYYKFRYKLLNIDIHGGISFAEYIENDLWIGWDYAHHGDDKIEYDLIDIIKDCCSVIMQLLEQEDGLS